MDFIKTTEIELQELMLRNQGRINSHNTARLRNAEQPDDTCDNNDEDQELPLCRGNVHGAGARSLACEVRFRSLRPPLIGIEVLVFWMWKPRLSRRRGVNLLWWGRWRPAHANAGGH